MSKMSTGLILGSIVGISSLALLNMDKKTFRKVQRKGQRILHKAEDMFQDMKEFF
jgi:hypothetical protein